MSRYWYFCSWAAYVLSIIQGTWGHDRVGEVHFVALGCFFLLQAIYHRRRAVSPEAPHGGTP